jgi:hypothetical protein
MPKKFYEIDSKAICNIQYADICFNNIHWFIKIVFILHYMLRDYTPCFTTENVLFVFKKIPCYLLSLVCVLKIF